MIILQNLTIGARWEPLSIGLDRSTGISRSIRKLVSTEHEVGIGSYLLTLYNGRLSRKLLAIYLINGDWMVFDGRQEVPMRDLVATWAQGKLSLCGIGIASLRLQKSDSLETITYFRPWLRQCFEGGWTLNDVDIAWVISRYVADEAARLRLSEALAKQALGTNLDMQNHRSLREK